MTAKTLVTPAPESTATLTSSFYLFICSSHLPDVQASYEQHHMHRAHKATFMESQRLEKTTKIIQAQPSTLHHYARVAIGQTNMMGKGVSPGV